MTRVSWASASMAPAAKAWPLMAATVYIGKASTRPSSLMTSLTMAPVDAASSGGWAPIQSRSSPFE